MAAVVRDRGVTPVIGVILLVAITVIVAAVIGGFVLTLGGDQEQTPQAAFELDAAPAEFGDEASQPDPEPGEGITLRKTGGDVLAVDELTVVVENTSSGNVQRLDLASDPQPEGVGVDTIQTADTIQIGYGLIGDPGGGSDTPIVQIAVTNDDTQIEEVPTSEEEIAEFDLVAGVEYQVTLIHEPSGGQIVDRTVTP